MMHRRSHAVYAARGPKGDSGSGLSIDSLRKNPSIFFDFTGQIVAGFTIMEPWAVGQVAGGTCSTSPGEPDHPGINIFNSSASANSGIRVQTYNSAHRFKGGEFFEFVFKIIANTNVTHRMGFSDNTSVTDATDGAYFELAPGTLDLVGKTANNGVRSTTPAILTLSLNTWYRARVEVNLAITQVTFTVWDMNEIQLGQQSLATDIPTAVGREFGHGVISTHSGTSAIQLAWYDYIAFGYAQGVVLSR